jgi:superfamily II DNA helicase RecQ
MQIKLFTVPIADNGTFEEELNRFLRANKILEVENQLVSNASGASWCFCVKYIGAPANYQKNTTTKKDYRHVLDEATFAVFSKLREIRKKLAAEDAVAAYVVATDQELAEIAKLKIIDRKGLLSVKGFGDKKFERYGQKLIEMIGNAPEENALNKEKSETPTG